MALKVGELFASFGIDTSGLDGAISGIESKCNGIASSMAKIGGIASAAITLPLVGAGKAIYKAGTDFDAQMSQVLAISGANQNEFQKLTQEALNMGSTTAFTATEAGEALKYMAMAGWETDAMLAGLAPVMNLAAASGENLGSVSDIVTDAMTAFGLTLEKAGGDVSTFNEYTQHFSDVLAAASSNSNTSVGIMGESFKYVASIAGSAGYSIDEMAVSLGILANNGIKGSQAGTGLARLINNTLNPTSKEAAALIKKLGIQMANASGEMLPWSDVVSQFRDRFSGLSEAQKIQYAETIAGQRGMTALLALVNSSDEDFAKLTAAVENCNGATEEMSKTMLDNAKGDVTLFKSAIEGLQITLWGLAENSFRGVVHQATKWIDSFRTMDSATQTAVVKVGALAAAFGPVVLAGSRLVKLVGRLIPLMHALVSPVGIAVGALALFAVAAVDANNDIGKGFVKLSKNVKSKLEVVNKSILSSIKTVSDRMPALISSVVEGVQNILPALTDTVMLGIIGMVDMIASNASGLLEIGTTIVSSIVGGISDSLPTLIPAAANMIASIATAMIANFPRIVGIIGELGSAVLQGLASIDWASIGSRLIESLSQSFGDTSGLLNGWLESLKSNFATINWSDVFGTVADIGTSLLSAVTTAIQNTSGFASDIVQTIGGMLAGVPWSGAIDTLSQLGEGFMNAVVAAIQGAGSIGTAIVEALGTMLGGIEWENVTVSLDGFANMLVSGIVKGLEALSTAGSSILNAIGGLLGQVDWNKFSSVAKTIASSLVSGIVLGIKGLTSAAASIFDALSSMIKSVRWEDVANSVSSIAGSLLDALLKGAESITPNISELLAAIGRGIEAGASALGTVAGTLVNNLVTFLLDPQNIVKLLQVGGRIVTGIAEGIIQLGESILKGATDFVMKTITGLLGALGLPVNQFSAETEAALDQVTQTVDQWGQEIQASLSANVQWLDNGPWLSNFTAENLQTAIANYANVVRYGTDELVASLDEYAWLGNEHITGAFMTLMSSTSTEAEKAAAYIALQNLGFDQMLSSNFDGLDEELAGTIASLGSTSVEAFEAAFTSIGYVIPNAVKEGLANGTMDVKTAAAQVVAAASTANEQAKAEASAKSTGTGVTSSLATGETAGKTNVETASQGVVDTATSTIETLSDATAIIGEDATNGMADSIQNSSGAVEDAMSTMSDAAVKAALLKMSYQTGYQTGYDYTSAIKAGIIAARESVVGAMRSIGSSALSSARLFMAYTSALIIGQNFTSGLAQGIRNGRSAVVLAAQQVASAAAQAAKETLDIRSPSRVARDEIGLMFDAGIVKGLQDGISTVGAASRGVADEMRNSFYVGDPSHGTVYTSRESVQQTARKTADATGERVDLLARARTIGEAIAESLIASGVLEGDVIMDGTKVGQKTAQAVSSSIAAKAHRSVKGRSAQGVLAT